MKTIRQFGILLLVALAFTGCKQISYRKTKSGLVYKIFPGNGTDSLIRIGDVVKFNYRIKYNDSVMENFDSYGKLPGYLKVRVQLPGKASYDVQELMTMLRKGDSLVTVQVSDTLLKQQSPFLPPNAKKGDRLTTTIRIIEVFRNDSLGEADYNREAERDRPRQEKAQEEMMAKMKKDKADQQMKEDEELLKSGEIAKETQEIEKYLADRKINAQKIGKGTFVEIKKQGSGPQAAPKKYVLVKYTGRLLRTDSVFQSLSYPFQLDGVPGVIRGWEEGLLVFKEGGNGTLYIPGFLAYGKNPPPGSPFKPYEPLKFDVELLKVSDQPIEQPAEAPVKKPQK